MAFIMVKTVKRKYVSCLFILILLGAPLLLAGCGNKTVPTESDTAPESEITMTQTAAQTAAGTEETGVEIISKAAVTVDMYDPAMDATKSAYQIAPGEKVGKAFVATAKFDMLTAVCPSWSNNIGNLRLSLYRWNESFDKTVAGEPIAQKLYENFNDCATLNLKFDAQPAGQYLFLFDEAYETVGVWIFRSTISKSVTFIDGLDMEGEIQTQIHYTETPKELFLQTPSPTDLSVYVTTPPPVVYPEDHPIHVRDAMPDTWVATDGLGRALPANEQTGDVKEDKFVGIFYWTWHLGNSQKPANLTNLISKYPEARNDYSHSIWDGVGLGHWNEPIFDYYTTLDEWVLRKHAEMLANAGVDVVIFDNTNGIFTWRKSYLKLLEVYKQARLDGVKTPQIAFLLPFSASDDSKTQLISLYKDIYRQGKYQDLWFYWKGKPLIMAYNSNLRRNNDIEYEILDFFSFRPGQPSYTLGQKVKNQWGWLSVYPQQVYKNADGTVEQVTVGVAQNHSKELGLTAMNGVNVFGRTYTGKYGYDTRENAKLYGANFAEQFEYAISVDPEFIFITGWNEWTAGRYPEWCGVKNAFPDEFDDTYSRDIEPSKGDLKDHYYYQMVSYIRQFKGTRLLPAPSAAKTIDINSTTDQWSDVLPAYYAYTGNTFDRSGPGYGGVTYTNTTGRNDLALAKVARDSKNIYFMVETKNTLSPSSDPQWMQLYIDTGDSAQNWEGYEYIVNRQSPAAKATLERSLGGWNWEAAGEIEYSVSQNRLQLKIPKSLLGIFGDNFTLNFKWADNTQNEGDIMDFYVNGDVAPGGRFMYCYQVKK